MTYIISNCININDDYLIYKYHKEPKDGQMRTKMNFLPSFNVIKPLLFTIIPNPNTKRFLNPDTYRGDEGRILIPGDNEIMLYKIFLVSKLLYENVCASLTH